VPPLEAALLTLVRRCFESPATLTPADTEPLRAAARIAAHHAATPTAAHADPSQDAARTAAHHATSPQPSHTATGTLLGERDPADAALTYVLVIGAFHYINRIADLLHVDSEILPSGLERFPLLRRATIFLASKLFARMDLANRRYPDSFETACAKMSPVFERATGRPLAGELDPLRPRPQMVEVLRHCLEERDERSSLTREQRARVDALVEQSLPRSLADAEGFHPRPSNAFDAFVFVGTRYAARTTPEMVDALRAEGMSDLGILDLAHAIADANQWARVHRLLGLPRDILSLA
jgi:hypothetical protein